MRTGQGNWRDCARRLLETYSSTQQIVAQSTAESEYISITKGAAHALEVRSAMVEYGMTFNVVCETVASAGRAMTTRRCVVRVRHLDARLLWLPRLESTTKRTKMVDLRRMTSLLKGTPLRPPVGWSLWMVKQQKIAVYLSGTCARGAAGSGSVWEWSL